jgi:hypothetical protein
VAVNGLTIIATLFIIEVFYETIKLHENKCCHCPTILVGVNEFLLTVS